MAGWVQIVLAVVGVFGGGVIGVVVKNWFDGRNRSREISVADKSRSRQDTRDEMTALYDRQQEEIKTLQDRVDQSEKDRRDEVEAVRKRAEDCHAELNKVWRTVDRLSLYNDYLRDELALNKITIRPWADPGAAERTPAGDQP